MNRIFVLLLLCFSGTFLSAQFIDHIGEDESGSFFGFRGGLSLATQNWNGLEMRPLLTYHGDFFLETLPEEGRFSLWTSLGYHIRGSRLQQRNATDLTGNFFRLPSENFQFRNLSLAVGGKQVFAFTAKGDLFYTIGLRLEYTLSNNLRDFDEAANGFQGFFPSESIGRVRAINYGVLFGGGIDIPLSDKVGAVIQVSAQPDFSFQYDQIEIPNVANPFRPGINTTIPARQIRNFTLEVSAGFRFLRKVTYID